MQETLAGLNCSRVAGFERLGDNGCGLRVHQQMFSVTGHFKTSQPGSNQNRPL
jgi:hypothetical protein